MKSRSQAAPVGVFVLGMHRSGTSLLARTLNLLGCAMPRDVLGANESNPTGHWESAKAIAINDHLLASLGRRWDDPRELPEGWLQRPEARDARVRIRAMLDGDFAGKPLWVLKEPRLCRLAPLWLSVACELGVDVRVIIPVRHPGEVAYSLGRRDGIAPHTAQLLWMRHLLEAEAATREFPRVVVDFDRLMQDREAELARVSFGLALAWPRSPASMRAQLDRFVDPDLRHSSPEDGVLDQMQLSGLVSRLYREISVAGLGQAWPLIQQASVPFAEASELFGPALDDAAPRSVPQSEPAVAKEMTTAAVEVATRLEVVQSQVVEMQASLGSAAPVALELVRQIEAQRSGLADTTERLAEDSLAIRQQIEAVAPLAVELVRQIEAQRDEIDRLAASVRNQMESQKSLMEAVDLAVQGEARARLAIGELEAQLASERREASDRQRQHEAAAIERLEYAREHEAKVLARLDAMAAELESGHRDRRALLDLLAAREEQARGLAAEREQLQAVVERSAAEVKALDERLRSTVATLDLYEQRHHAVTQDLAGREGELAAAEESERALRADLEAMGRVQKDLERRLADEQSRVNALLQSTSWRMTAPLRRIWTILRGRAPASAEDGGMLRSMYLALPVPWSLRLRAKGLAFRLLAPFIRNTDPYRRWRSQNRVGEVPLLGTQEPMETAPGKPSRRVSRPRVDSAYVPIAPDSVAMKQLKAKLIAFYLPQFHPIPENDEWWGRGFTEWTNVTKAKPQFDGHGQPHLPGELGFYDLRVPQVMERQVELARQYGVHGFCFHYYWFDGRRILEGPLNRFLDDASLDFPFCICWANENWTRRWDGHDNDVLLGQNHSPESDLRFIQDVEPILRDPRYIRVDGRPLLVVYRPSLLPDCTATVARWREHCRASGLGEILLVMVQFDLEDPRALGFDVALEFPPHKLARNLPSINATLEGLNPEFKGYVVDYQAVVERSRKWPVPEFDMIRGVFPGWDNEARKPGQGYVFAHSSPGRYRDWLQFAVDYARRHPVAGESLVFVNAWNEWAEGAYLEPDRRHGYAYLQATREALTADSAEPQSEGEPVGEPPSQGARVIVVSHDAHPHGAQYLALNLCRELSRMGIPVDAVLLGGGALEAQFAEVASLHVLDPSGGEPAALALARELVASGATLALANTAVSGCFAGVLARAGVAVVSMVHELPGVLRQYGLQEHSRQIVENATAIVFAAEAVAEGFAGFCGMDPARATIRPQGLYKRNRSRSPESIAKARAALRANFGLASGARIVLGMGYADHRKGIDLFVEAAPHVLAAEPEAHFVWAGHFDVTLEAAIRARVRSLGLAERFHFPGRIIDTDDYYAGADVFALTSREDPFPSVVMESLDVGVPVVAFAGTGGSEALLRRAGGLLVEPLAPAAFAAACVGLLGDEALRTRLGEEGRAIVETEFSFRRYVFDLLALGGRRLPRVSAVIPNYNYAHWLEARLASVQAQTLPVFETIVLDDASTDASLEELDRLHQRFEFRVLRNRANSGSVFRQWLKGVEAARGDFVWIAEADDLSEPAFLEAALAGFSHAGVVMSYTESRQMAQDGSILADHYRDYVADISSDRWTRPYVVDGGDEVAEVLAVKNSIPNVSAVLFRREPILAVLREHIADIAGFRVAGDWATYVLLLRSGKIAFNPAPLNLHRRNPGGVTSTLDRRVHFNEVRYMQHRVAGDHPVPAATLAKAGAYAAALQKQFGLSAADGAQAPGAVLPGRA